LAAEADMIAQSSFIWLNNFMAVDQAELAAIEVARDTLYLGALEITSVLGVNTIGPDDALEVTVKVLEATRNGVDFGRVAYDGLRARIDQFDYRVRSPWQTLREAGGSYTVRSQLINNRHWRFAMPKLQTPFEPSEIEPILAEFKSRAS
jgi:hypothetical protein